MTEAVANHVISLQMIGTDCVRKYFSSKESSQVNHATVFLGKLKSMKAEDSAPETTTTLPPKKGSSLGKYHHHRLLQEASLARYHMARHEQ